jgi:transcriptional regulator with XRE-family HTH domain
MSAGLTQENTAERARLDYKHFQAIEAGSSNVTVASLVGIAKALRVTLADLFDHV